MFKIIVFTQLVKEIKIFNIKIPTSVRIASILKLIKLKFIPIFKPVKYNIINIDDI